MYYILQYIMVVYIVQFENLMGISAWWILEYHPWRYNPGTCLGTSLWGLHPFLGRGLLQSPLFFVPQKLDLREHHLNHLKSNMTLDISWQWTSLMSLHISHTLHTHFRKRFLLAPGSLAVHCQPKVQLWKSPSERYSHLCPWYTYNYCIHELNHISQERLCQTKRQGVAFGCLRGLQVHQDSISAQTDVCRV